MVPRKTSHRIILLIATVFLVAGAVRAVTGRMSAVNEEKRADAELTKSLDDLYREADEDLKNGRSLEAAGKFDQLANTRPGFKDTEKRLDTAIARAVKQAEQSLAAGNATEAGEDLRRLDQIDGDNPVVDDLLKKTKPQPGKLSDKNATPLSILPGVVNGYTVKNEWLKEPTLAGATYLPTGATAKKRIDRAWLTVEKTTNKGAGARLAGERKLFANEAAQLKINGAKAYSGTYGGVLSVVWTRGKWFFSVQILPGETQSTGFMRGAAVDIAKKLEV